MKKILYAEKLFSDQLSSDELSKYLDMFYNRKSKMKTLQIGDEITLFNGETGTIIKIEYPNIVMSNPNSPHEYEYYYGNIKKINGVLIDDIQ